MTKRLPVVALRLALLFALTACVVLHVDYQSAAGGSFCGAGGGCAAVRASRFSHIGPIGLPLIGIVTFSGLLAVSLVGPLRATRGFLASLVLCALGALGLIGVQLGVVGALCPWCMVVDVSAIAAAAAGFWTQRTASEQDAASDGRPQQLIWAVAAAVGVVLPLVWPAQAPSVKLPPELESLQQSGRVTVVSFTDFECPYCRRLSPVLHKLYEAVPGKKYFERRMVPLPFHRGADAAARAYVCADASKREAFAKKLYAATPEQMTRKGVADMAQAAGLPAKAFAACYDSAETKASIAADKKLFKSASLAGLPATFVNRQLIVGADESALKTALENASRGEEGGGDTVWMLTTLAIVFAAAVVASMRLSPP